MSPEWACGPDFDTDPEEEHEAHRVAHRFNLSFYQTEGSAEWSVYENHVDALQHPLVLAPSSCNLLKPLIKLGALLPPSTIACGELRPGMLPRGELCPTGPSRSL